ncbi:helix-turn-helix transcriptional regulator [bacterium]|nr:helix-turn-helix transcriptional regulator [bacterium]
MQYKDEKTLQLRNILGESCKELRQKIGLSCNNFEDAYDFSKGNINRIENAIIDCKVITLWKISEALGMKPSEFMKAVEEKLGDDFTLIDE